MEVGILLPITDRSPNCPAALEPQQNNSPENMMAQECAPPQPTEAAVANEPEKVMTDEEFERMRVGET